MNDNKKRYVLFSKDDGRSDAEKPCAFFASPAGCKNGNNCKFLHGAKQNIVSLDNLNQSLNNSNTLSLSYNSNDNTSSIDNSNNTNKRIKSKDKKNRNTDNQYDHKTTTVDSSSSSSFPTYANNNNSNNYNNHASSQLLQSHPTTTTAATSVVSSNSNVLIIQQLRDQLAQQQQLLNTHVLTNNNNNNVNNQAFNHNQAVSNNTYNHNQVTTHTPGSGVDTNHLQTITQQSSSSSSSSNTKKKQEKKRKSSDGIEFNDNSSPINTSNKKKSSNDTSSSVSVSTNNHMDLPYHSNPYSSIIASTQLIAGNSTSTSNQYHHQQSQQQQQPSIASITNYETNDDYDDDEDEDNNQFLLSVVNHVLDNSAQKSPLQQNQFQQQQHQPPLLLQQQQQQQQLQQKQQLPQQPHQPQHQYVMSHLPPPVSNQHQIIAPTGMEIKQPQPLIQTNNSYTALPTTAASSSSSIVATNPFINSQDALKALQSSGSTHALYGVSKKNIFATPKISTNNHSSTSNSMNNNSSSISNDVKVPKNIFNPALVNFHELPWMKLVEQTKLNYRYPNNYTYIEDSSWVKAKIHGTWCINNNNIKNVISLDCEMCETTDPVTNTKYDNTLIRISVFDIDHKVLIDSLVQPGLPITETRTNIHGITEKQLVLAPWTLRQAQAALLNICSDQTIIIGHSIHKDLKSLKFNHKNVIDTAYLYTVDNEPGAAPSLRDISEQILGIKLPETHNSIQDAQAALYAAATLLAYGPQPSISRKSSSSSLTKEFSLLIHRVPDYCNEEQLHHMIIDYTYIVPIKVNTIIRGDSGSSSGSNGNDNKNNNDYQKKGDIPSGKTMITFSTQQHRDLAFESIVGPNRPDKQNRPQKRIYFKGGGYICIRR